VAEKNEIKDIVAELIQLRIAITGLNPDPISPIEAYREEKHIALDATKTLAASTKSLMRATWALVGVTVLLAIAALGPAVETFRGRQDEWVLYGSENGYGATGMFQTLEACRAAEKRAPYSRGCFPRGVNPR